MFLRGIFLGVLMLMAAIGHFGASVSAQASIHTYGSCNYNEQCADEAPVSRGDATTPADDLQRQSTVLSLSGLDVAVNLHDGQTLPRSGYAIVVTPLNGRGTTFQEAAFFVDGVMSQRAAPDVTGTARWMFRPDAEQVAATIKIVVSGQNQASVAKEFSIRITANAALSGGPRAAVGRSDIGDESAVVAYLRGAVAKVPSEVLRSFPYVLFLLLGADVLVLLLLTLREVGERRAVNHALVQINEIAGIRKEFNQLVSHYLRTPLTLVDGGLDMLRRQEDAQQTELSRLDSEMEKLRLCVASLIQRAADTSSDAADPVVLSPGQVRSLSAQLYVYIPVALIGALLTLANYLTSLSDTLTVSTTSLVMQAAAFGGSAALLYLAYRTFVLHRKNTMRTRAVLSRWKHINDAREAFVVETAKSLQQRVHGFTLTLETVRPSSAKKFADNGVQRFAELAEKCSIAASLRGAHSSKPQTASRVSEITDRAQVIANEKMTAKRAVLKTTGDPVVYCRDQALLAFVLGSLFNNAAEYGPDGVEILVDVTAARQATEIRVTNNGSAIPAQTIEALFEPFAKGDGVETFNHDGPGLSLYLDRLVLCYLGGTIAIDSRAGSTTVTICLDKS